MEWHYFRWGVFRTAPSRSRERRKQEADALTEDVRAVSGAVAALYERRATGDEPSGADWCAAWQQACAARQQADAARQQSDAVWQQAYAARQQADAAGQQSDAVWRQAYAARQQADAAGHAWYSWCLAMLCEEVAK